MKNHLSRWARAALVVLVAIATAAPSLASSDATALKGKPTGTNGLITPGSEPPRFTLQDLDGKPVALEDYLGKKTVMLVFWSFFCGPCREEIPLLDREILARYKDRGLEMFAINLDGPKMGKAVRRYMDSNGFGFRVLWEEIDGITYKTADAYGVVGTPSLVLIDRAGTVSWTHVGREKVPTLMEVVEKALEDG